MFFERFDRVTCKGQALLPGQLFSFLSTSTMSVEEQSSLRLRKKTSKDSQELSSTISDRDDTPKREEVVWGKTPSGEGMWNSGPSKLQFLIPFNFLFQYFASPLLTMSSLRFSTLHTPSLISTSSISGR